MNNIIKFNNIYWRKNSLYGNYSNKKNIEISSTEKVLVLFFDSKTKAEQTELLKELGKIRNYKDISIQVSRLTKQDKIFLAYYRLLNEFERGSVYGEINILINSKKNNNLYVPKENSRNIITQKEKTVLAGYNLLSDFYKHYIINKMKEKSDKITNIERYYEISYEKFSYIDIDFLSHYRRLSEFNKGKLFSEMRITSIFLE